MSLTISLWLFIFSYHTATVPCEVNVPGCTLYVMAYSVGVK